MGKTVAILAARLIFGAVFLMAATFKFLGMESTASFIAAAGFPIPLVLAWLAAFFELRSSWRFSPALSFLTLLT